MPRSPKGKGTAGETDTLRRCLVRIWPRMERSGSKVAYGQLPDYDDPDQRCPFAIEHKFVKQQRLEEWWAQTLKSASKVARIPLLIWKRDGRPADPWVVMTWLHFEPIATFIDAHLDEFLEHAKGRDAMDPLED